MKCNKAKKMMPQYYYKDLTRHEMAEFESHIKVCSRCKKSFEETTDFLDKLKPAAVPCRIKPLNIYLEGIYKKMEKKQSPLEFLLLRPVVSFATIVILAVAIFLGVNQYTNYKEHQFIMGNYELIRNMDMFEDMEILKDIEALELMEESI